MAMVQRLVGRCTENYARMCGFWRINGLQPRDGCTQQTHQTKPSQLMEIHSRHLPRPMSDRAVVSCCSWMRSTLATPLAFDITRLASSDKHRAPHP
ncbi:hypothetical protein VITFI_CDS3122 [Vitreoscilla filiformis]|uniref:Uncharacterized protein n=1 Tax=Vitreoscilla filiformis TaxID=63 RepID=A0A221KJ15_VITFI|nr:hypothetical protein VITFI_CDS3122 [Vitreoscilla filiformis]